MRTNERSLVKHYFLCSRDMNAYLRRQANIFLNHTSPQPRLCECTFPLLIFAGWKLGLVNQSYQKHYFTRFQLQILINMSDSVTIRLRKVMRNPLLQRRQAVVECIHPNKASVSQKDARAQIAKMMKVANSDIVFVFGLRTGYGGGKSSGFALIYDDVEAAKKFEPKHRLIRNGLKEKVSTSKKQKTEKKNRDKKFRGTGRRIALRKQKRAQ